MEAVCSVCDALTVLTTQTCLITEWSASQVLLLQGFAFPSTLLLFLWQMCPNTECA